MTTSADSVERRLLPPVMFSRILSDTSNQLFNPFLGIIASGLGIPVQQFGLLLGLRSLAGLSGPLLGSVADRWGALRVAKLGIVLMAAGLLALAASSTVHLVFLAMVAMGVALGVVNPALQAHVSALVEYRRRARVLSVVEYSWALAGIVGLTATGWLISGIGWRPTIVVIALLLLLSLRGLNRLALGDVTSAGPIATNRPALTSTAWLGALIVGLLFFSVFNVMIVHGVWLTTAFGLGPKALGLVSLVLGVADLVGAGSVALSAGRFNVGKLALASTTVGAAVYVGLGLATGTLLGAILALAVARSLMQVGFISMLTLLSEVSPGSRGLVMTLAAAVGQVGMAIAAGTGPWVYEAWGLAALAGVSGTSLLVAAVIVFVFIRGLRVGRSTLL